MRRRAGRGAGNGGDRSGGPVGTDVSEVDLLRAEVDQKKRDLEELERRIKELEPRA
jgi:hypothetical protein